MKVESLDGLSELFALSSKLPSVVLSIYGNEVKKLPEPVLKAAILVIGPLAYNGGRLQYNSCNKRDPSTPHFKQRDDKGIKNKD